VEEKNRLRKMKSFAAFAVLDDESNEDWIACENA
jgi:hypothetical protein